MTLFDKLKELIEERKNKPKKEKVNDLSWDTPDFITRDESVKRLRRQVQVLRDAEEKKRLQDTLKAYERKKNASFITSEVFKTKAYNKKDSNLLGGGVLFGKPQKKNTKGRGTRKA
jgi:hypothetical protein